MPHKSPSPTLRSPKAASQTLRNCTNAALFSISQAIAQTNHFIEHMTDFEAIIVLNLVDYLRLEVNDDIHQLDRSIMELIHVMKTHSQPTSIIAPASIEKVTQLHNQLMTCFYKLCSNHKFTFSIHELMQIKRHFVPKLEESQHDSIRESDIYALELCQAQLRDSTLCLNQFHRQLSELITRDHLVACPKKPSSIKSCALSVLGVKKEMNHQDINYHTINKYSPYQHPFLDPNTSIKQYNTSSSSSVLTFSFSHFWHDARLTVCSFFKSK